MLFPLLGFKFGKTLGGYLGHTDGALSTARKSGWICAGSGVQGLGRIGAGSSAGTVHAKDKITIIQVWEELGHADAAMLDKVDGLALGMGLEFLDELALGALLGPHRANHK